MRKHLPILALALLGALLFSAPATIAQIRTMYFGSVVINDTGANALVVGGAPGATTGTGGIKAGPIVSGSTITAGTNVSDAGGTLDAVRDGGWTLASQAAGDIFYATSASQAGRLNGSGLVRVNGSSAPTAVNPATVGGVLLVGGATGTSTAGAATNVATIALSGLTQFDVLRVYVTMTTVGGTTTNAPELYNATDSVSIIAGAGVGTGVLHVWDAIISCSPQAATAVQAQMLRSNNNAPANISAVSTFVTPFTGSWSLALRTGASGTDGTFHYTVRVFKVVGS